MMYTYYIVLTADILNRFRLLKMLYCDFILEVNKSSVFLFYNWFYFTKTTLTNVNSLKKTLDPLKNQRKIIQSGKSKKCINKTISSFTVVDEQIT